VLSRLATTLDSAISVSTMLWKKMLAVALTVPAVFAAWKLWGPSIFNRYDGPGETSSLREVCIFCKKVHEKQKVVFEDEEVFVMHDDFPKSSTHLLVLSKRHIKNTSYLQHSDRPLLEKMMSLGERLAKELIPTGQLK